MCVLLIDVLIHTVKLPSSLHNNVKLRGVDLGNAVYEIRVTYSTRFKNVGGVLGHTKPVMH
jgi:hypothetical protein